MSFNFQNLDLINVEFSSGSSVIPVGDHVATVTGAEMTKTKTGASQIMVTVENNDGQTLRKWITIHNPNSEDNTRSGRAELKALLVHGNHKDPDNIGQHGIESMIGLKVGIKVVEDTYTKDGQERVGSKLKSFIPPMNADASFNPPKEIASEEASSASSEQKPEGESTDDDEIPF